MNKEIKLAMLEADLKQFELASLLNIHEGTLSKMLNRKEITKEKKEEILKKIKEANQNGTK